ncbi:MAG: response regulator transcription factor [Saprospiraceae bacterium]|nr:response regulator transcription factor [Saprospiraceae bacterium]MBK7796543.1 response regulator transcription factor [Saprospiraceae bacterium]
MKKVRIIAIEDDLTLLDFVCTALEKMSDVELIDRAEDVDTAYALIIKHKPDALFTDIEIRGGIVITQVLQKLKLNGYEIPWLVFLTGHPGYGSNIINEFSHRAVKYIDKPFIHHWEVKFREALDEIHKRRYAIQDKEAIQAKNHFFIKQKDQLIRLEYDRILWITAAGNGKSFYVTEQEDIPVDNSLNSILDFLDPDRFIRISRETIIAIDKIQRLIRDERILTILRRGKETSHDIGDNYYSELLKRLK